MLSVLLVSPHLLLPHVRDLKGQDTYHVCVHLKLHRQHRRRNIVHQIRRAHRVPPTDSKAPAAIWVVRVSDLVRGRIDDVSEVGEVLDGRGCDGKWSQDGAHEEHG
jgi:hypothetical protein